jgi:hypothetical protein
LCLTSRSSSFDSEERSVTVEDGAGATKLAVAGKGASSGSVRTVCWESFKTFGLE